MDELFENRKVHDLVTKAEIEYEQLRHDLEKAAKGTGQPAASPPNVFFNSTKSYLGLPVRTMWANSLVLLLIVFVITLFLRFFLKRQLTRV